MAGPDVPPRLGQNNQESNESKKTLDVAALKSTIEGLLVAKGAKAKKLEIKIDNGRVSIDAEVDHSQASGLKIKGILANLGNEIGLVGEADIKAGNIFKTAIVKGVIGPVLSKIGQAIRAHFEKETGRPIESLKIEEGGLTLNFKVDKTTKAEVVTTSQPPAPPAPSEPRNVELPNTKVEDLSVPDAEDLAAARLEEEEKEVKEEKIEKPEVPIQVEKTEKDKQIGEYREELIYLEEKYPEEITKALEDGGLNPKGTSEERVERLLNLGMPLEVSEKPQKQTDLDAQKAKEVEEARVRLEGLYGEEKAVDPKKLAEIERLAQLRFNGGLPTPADAPFWNENEPAISARIEALEAEKNSQATVSEAKKTEPRGTEGINLDPNVEPTEEDLRKFANFMKTRKAELVLTLAEQQFQATHGSRLNEILAEELKVETRPLSEQIGDFARDVVARNINIRNINSLTEDQYKLYTKNEGQINELIKRLRTIKGIEGTKRVGVKSPAEKVEAGDLQDRINKMALFLIDGGELTTDESIRFYNENERDIKKAEKYLDRKDRQFERTMEDIMEKNRKPNASIEERFAKIAVEKDGGSLADQAKAQNERLRFEKLEPLMPEPHVRKVMESMNLLPIDFKNHAPDFFELDSNKQLYVLEKLKQKVNHDASLQAEEKIEKELKEHIPVFLSWKSKVLISTDWRKWRDYGKRTWKKFTKEFQETKERRKIVQEIKQKEMEGYEGDLKAITDHVARLKVPMEYKDGKLYIEYENSKDNVLPPEKVREFNEAATALSELPYEWSQGNAGILEKRKYKKALALYETKRAVLMQAKIKDFKEKKGGSVENSEQAGMLWTNNLDSSIKMNQLLTSFPDLDKEDAEKLGKIPGLKHLNADDFTSNLSNWAKARIGFAVGFGTRIITRDSLEFLGALTVAGGLGGLLGGRKKFLEYKDIERKKRYGANIEDKSVKTYMDAKPQIEKLQNLIERFDIASAEARKSEKGQMALMPLAQLLRNRVFAIDERVQAGRMKFGSKTEQVPNKLKLYQLITEANSKLFLAGAYSEVAESAETLKRLNRLQNDTWKDVRKGSNIALAVGVGAAVTGAGYVGGYFLADWYKGDSGQSFVNRVKEMIDFRGDGPQDDVLPGPVKSYPAPEAVRVESSAPRMDGSPAPIAPVESEVRPEQPAVESPEPETSAEKPKVTPTSEEELLKKIKSNIREIRDVDGNLVRMEINNASKVEDALKFRKNPGAFLVEDLSRSDLPIEKQNRGWGIAALNKVKEQGKDFLAWQDYIKIYPDGTPEHEWIEKEMERLGDDIRSKVGNIFAPYENMVGAPSVPEAEGDISTPSDNATASLDPMAGVDVPTERESLKQVFERSATPPVAEAPAAVEELVRAEVLSAVPPEAPVSIPMEGAPAISDGVTRSVENGNLVLGFDDERIYGHLRFIEGDGVVTDVVEDRDFSTEAGKQFRNNYGKYISDEDINKIINGLKVEGYNINKSGVIDQFENFIDRREVLQAKVLSADSNQALALKRQMLFTDKLFEKYTGVEMMDRLHAVESGVGISTLAEETPTITIDGKEIVDMRGPDIDTKSEIFNDAVKEFGKAEVGGSVALFEDGYVGFYSDSTDEQTARMVVGKEAESNRKLWSGGGPVRQIMRPTGDGKFQVFSIYKKAL